MPLLRLEASMRLPLNELFETVQGEGSKTGTPSTFIRLQGCDVGCPWCDTKHTWTLNEASALSDVLDKHDSDERFAWVAVEDVVTLVDGRQTKHVVITGGEPCQYDLRELTQALIDHGHSVQIETSGTEPVRAANDVFVTLSPIRKRVRSTRPTRNACARSASASAKAQMIKRPIIMTGDDKERVLDCIAQTQGFDGAPQTEGV
jgi:putative 7-cyano-7-deazaguanosine (preQ0) biosynthesis protein QueE